jgi:hypothetical protein
MGFLVTLQDMRACIALLFLFIFSFQVLPVRALGKMIAKAQMTEEVKGDCDDDANNCTDDTDADGGDGDGKGSKTGTEKETSQSKIDDLHFVDAKRDISFLFTFRINDKKVLPPDDDLIQLFVKDIHCPPPNC